MSMPSNLSFKPLPFLFTPSLLVGALPPIAS